MHDTVLEKLYEPFDLKARQGVGGKTFKYVPSDDIVDRMNRVFKGNWETNVVSSERFEDHIIMHVKVSVKDPESGQMFSHDGFASQQIARFTSGQKNGQTVEIGNSYKSAMSKAVKSAVVKWGVALYLEGKEDAPTSTNPTPDTNPVMNVPSGPLSNAGQPGVPTPPPIGAPMPGMNTPVGPSAGAPSGPPMGPAPMNAPSTNTPPMNTPKQEAPVFTNNNIVSTNSGSPVESFTTDAANDSGISDVQKQAISHILDLNNMDYVGLAKLALQAENVPEIDNLAYSQAIKVIQYGNNLSAATS